MTSMDTKFKIGSKAFVVDKVEFDFNRQQIPLGTEVMVQGVLVFHSQGTLGVRYEVNTGALVCWIDETRLSPRILDIAV